MDLNDVELMESLPTGIILDANIKDLDRFGYSFSLSGLDFETCVTFSCAKEVVRFSPIKIIIAEKQFVGGDIGDLVDLSRSSGKYFKVVLWTDSRAGFAKNEILQQKGISAILLKDQPFDKILKKVKDLLTEQVV